MSPTKTVVAKNRWHKGVTAAFRRRMRRAGLSFDEEQAQFILGGTEPVTGPAKDYVAAGRDLILGDRFEHMRQWERENPDRNPFPPSFPTRVLALVNAAIEALNEDDGVPLVPMLRLQAIASAETQADPFGPPDDMDIPLL